MDLSELRVEIDNVDRQMVELFEKRMDIASRIADYKIANGKKVFDRDREIQKIKAVKELAHSDFNKVGVEELFSQLMSVSRKLQYQKLQDAGASGHLPFIPIDSIDKKNSRVCYQGAEGAYSELAMKEFFGDDVNCFHVETFRDAMQVLEEGSADYAVLPIENSTAGVISETYDLLTEYENYIVGEQIIEIRNLVKSLGQKHTVILSSHILSEVQAICDRVVIISNGKVVADETTEGLSKKLAKSNRLLVEAEGAKSKILDIISTLSDVKNVKTEREVSNGVYEFSIDVNEDADIRKKLFFAFAGANIPILGLKSDNITLEEAFLRLTSDTKYSSKKGGDK